MIVTDSKALGLYLRSRRLRLDAAALGFIDKRRRTAGLRREEVAQRANISNTWYICLEQGRGGPPSGKVLDRICRALVLSAAEREHAFMLGLGRLPEASYKAPEGIAHRLQQILDALDVCPALIRTATWDIVAWNRAAALVLADYGSLEPRERNALRLMFLSREARDNQVDWETLARFVVAAFRADAARSGAATVIEPLVAELSQASPEFAAMWQENDVRGFSEGVKTLRHPTLGELRLEYSSFAIDGRTDLTMLVYTTSSEDAFRIREALIHNAKEQRKRGVAG
ncbi:helix-turn-helix transcriptional regulator (plasmid) [Paraburkholderia sp. D15]|uniref:helix-turn-helix transcriptional regulator n=1 Tax=Paraburkholderia sp. D15 TaxID=2880218 RepID=UPI002479CCDF|nr:helix-turn-helix transcriptional regulator [Paraburkholderia sp. D15]WGS55287.1 helix-turn-helix transcriptional regulator [Paraburkholderia sp. D15]